MAHLVWFSAGVLWAGALAVVAGEARGVRRARLWWLSLLTASFAWLLGLLAVVAAAGWFPLPWQGADAWPWLHDAVEGVRVWRLGEAQQPLLVLALTAVWVALLVDAARAERVAREGYGWAALLALGGLAVPAVLAATPVAWVMFWVALDAAAFVADAGRLSRPKHRNQAVWVLFLRSASWFMALGGAAAAAGALGAGVGVGLWGGALALRLTVAAFQPAVMAADRPPWRLTLAALNTLATLAAMGWLRAADPAAPAWMLWGAALLAWWGAWRWGAASTPLRAVSAGGMALGSLALLGALEGRTQASLAWVWLAAALPLGMALVPHRGRALWPFFAALTLPLGLLPLTVGQAAAALWSPPFHGWMLLAWLALAASGVALGRQGIRLPADCPKATREGRAFCLFGLALWAVVLWLGWFWPPLHAVGGRGWLWGLTALGAAAAWLSVTGRGYLHTDRAEAWVARGAGFLAGALFWGAYRLVGRTLRFFSLLLEGEGGVLWALVLLAMLAVLVQR